MNRKQNKLENPERLAELNPTETLEKIGLGEYDILCDIGAGTGIFTIPAAKITKNKVYALENDDEMLSVIGNKANNEEISNIELIKVEGDHYGLCDHSVDIVLIVTVLHEIDNQTIFLEEVKRISKENGKIVVIEFHKKKTPMGPPIERRMEKAEVIDLLKNINFILHQNFDLGDNFYCLIFEPSN